MKIKTVLINSNGAPLRINAADFRHGSDVLWGEDTEAKTKPKPKTKKADVKVSHKGGGKWIVEVNGEQVHDGLLSKKAAQALAEQY